MPFAELSLPDTSSAAVVSRGRGTSSGGDVIDVLRNIVRIMTSLDANEVTQHLLDRTAHLDSVPAVTGNDMFWRDQIKEVTESMQAGQQRAALAKRKRRHESGACLLSDAELLRVETALKNLPAPYAAEVPAAPGRRFTFKTEVTLGLSGSSPLLASNAPLVPAAMGGDLGPIKATPCTGDRVQLSPLGGKDRCLAPGDVGVVVECLAGSSSTKPVRVRAPNGKISHYRARELVVVGPVPVLVQRPAVGDSVKLAQFAIDHDGCLLSTSDIGIVVRDDPTNELPICVSCELMPPSRVTYEPMN